MADEFVPTQQQTAPQGAVPVPEAKADFTGSARVIGDPQDDIKRRQALDPTGTEEVTDEEQAEYDDFVGRCIAMISDTRVPEGGENGGVAISPSDAVLKVMSNSSFSVPQALSAGAVNTAFIIHDAAKQAGKEYSPDVLFHGIDEVIAGLYLLGSAAGIFDGASDYSKTGGGLSAQQQPATDPAQMQLPMDGAETGAIPPADGAMAAPSGAMQDSEGDFTDDEYMLMAEAKMLATEEFGRRLVESGQLTEEDQKEAQEFWQSQIAAEVERGEVPDELFDSMDVPAIRKAIASRGV